MLLADFEAFELEQIFSALNRVAEGAVGVVEQGGVGQTHLLLFGGCAGEAVRVQATAQAVKFTLQRGRIQAEFAVKPEDLEIVGVGSWLDFAAGRAEQRG